MVARADGVAQHGPTWDSAFDDEYVRSAPTNVEETVRSGQAGTLRAMPDPPRDPAAPPPGDALTRTTSGREAPTPRIGSGGSSGSVGFVDHGRFPPGHVLAQRYRIIELLGKGGMGEVYRADDLTLGQTIALKFLYADRRDDESLAALHQEVRIARQVTHPNVCRVYDVGEFDGHAFLTMEYIDGENLGSLISRIGRLSRGKAIEIAQQLCAGLAAAHDQGILHRDLKPSNVMIDGRGRVRITDFGLANVATRIAAADVTAGTPAYMAPEQLAGREVTVRSDLFALGLILYEVFTGKRAISDSPLVRLRDGKSSITPPSHVAADLDPEVERMLLRCLSDRAGERPESARAVLAALPGFDPLAAAIAAGQTPSPEMVAAAQPKGRLRPAVGASLAVFVMIATFAYAWCIRPMLLIDYVALNKSPAVLADRAQEMLARIGHHAAAVDTAIGFEPDTAYLRSVRRSGSSPERWAALRTDEPPAIRFWYRSSPAGMKPANPRDIITADDPPLIDPGMTLVSLTPTGRLDGLRVVPPRAALTPTASSPAPNWSLLFELAGLDESQFAPAAPAKNPPFFCEERRSWTGAYPLNPATPIRIEAAAYDGKCVYFEIIGAWHEPTGEIDRVQRADSALGAVNVALLAICLAGAGWLAWRNTMLGRGDHTGARRVGVVMFAISFVAFLLRADHTGAIGGEIDVLQAALRDAGFRGLLGWLLYLALEPIVRRRYPDALISWTRLLAGRFTDPIVGRDVLVGVALGVSVLLLAAVRLRVLAAMGIVLQPETASFEVLCSPFNAVGLLIEAIVWSISSPMVLLLFTALLMMLIPSTRTVMAATFVLLTAIAAPIAMLASDHALSILPVAIAVVAALVVALWRFGMVALGAALYTQSLVGMFWVSSDFGHWYAGPSILAIAVIVAVAAWAFQVSRAGQPLISTRMLDA